MEMKVSSHVVNFASLHVAPEYILVALVEIPLMLNCMILKEIRDCRLFIEPGPLPKPGTASFFECVTTDAALVIDTVHGWGKVEASVIHWTRESKDR
ncbi:hypothetical protein TNIN_462961 [Trichonephila inaurata madagascariensis]|uniref:Uncharacterized protein n=1 Tax=Trichonephila inaurata madagascariensis TaxID=2747483 RepID=A0A8X6X2S0_9ARAC|nr:hypothetical protein TNIN_462961 [Trichonephila inaurata madagascariensis]